jgi:hypothetical protein
VVRSAAARKLSRSGLCTSLVNLIAVAKSPNAGGAGDCCSSTGVLTLGSLLDCCAGLPPAEQPVSASAASNTAAAIQLVLDVDSLLLLVVRGR